MTFVQATTGQGGWPMSVWLTPDLQPFYGGTYFPPTSRWGRPGLLDVLRHLSQLWREDRTRVVESAAAITARLRAATESAGASATAGRRVAAASALLEGAQQFVQAFDERWGGFGAAPKFPRPSELLFLLRAYACSGDAGLLAIVTDTLRALALGGMRDHIGGGFHRYSVDREWRVPHFEKMLYDQAQLVLALLETAQASGEGFWTWIAEDTLDYVRRDLTHPEGGFFSAEDADSVPPEAAGDPSAQRTEGAFYLWRADEIDRLLGADAPLVRQRFGILADGNAPHDPHGEFTGRNLLYTAASVEDLARTTARSQDEVFTALNRARLAMFEARATRPRPRLDDKVLTSWNGLMIAAAARASRVLDDGATDGARGAGSWAATAERAAGFLRVHAWDEASATLKRRVRNGDASVDGYCEDYAYLVWGLLELFQTTGAAEWLEWAIALQRRQDELFADEGDGGWFNTTGRDPSVLLRLKDDYDGAEPAASSVAVMNLLVLGHLVADQRWARLAEGALARFGDRLGSAARAMPFLLSNLAAYHRGLTQVVLVGPAAREDTVALRRTLTSHYLPFSVTIPVVSAAGRDRLGAILPWVAPMTEIDGRSAAYVCRGFACERPVTSPEDLAALLDADR
jgi:uncharacterized protein YyaL (SSP411 family)